MRSSKATRAAAGKIGTEQAADWGCQLIHGDLPRGYKMHSRVPRGVSSTRVHCRRSGSRIERQCAIPRWWREAPHISGGGLTPPDV
eukprot:scaffold7417_cov258-Pinguiococcus_pyrenoidosus.AAC.2